MICSICTKCHFCLPDSNNRKFGKGLLENQWNILFCKTRNKCKDGKAECCCMYDAEVNIKEEDLDISLTVCLLINLFPISAVEKQDLINLRDERNIYAHAKKESLEMEENDFTLQTESYGFCYQKQFMST